MVWKNLSRLCLADTLVTQDKALEELDDVSALIDWSEIETTLNDIYNKKRSVQAWPR